MPHGGSSKVKNYLGWNNQTRLPTRKEMKLSFLFIFVFCSFVMNSNFPFLFLLLFHTIRMGGGEEIPYLNELDLLQGFTTVV